MNQTIFMAVVTAAGVLGALFVQPFFGVAVYYLFAVLRPQSLWNWALPHWIPWSEVVAWPTIVAAIWFVVSGGGGVQRPRLSAAHKAVLVFGVWICVTYVTAQDQDTAWFWFLEYIKLFIMFGVAALVVNNIRQVWWIYLISTICLVYIAYEMNFLYFTVGRLDIYHNGYGGLDNNGAALMLAMAVPLSIYAWEAITKVWRWVFIAAVPLLVHAVLMSYSRGAMLSLLVATPLLILRSRRRKQFVFIFLLLLGMVPLLAGQEIRQEFLSVQGYEADGSANSRFQSWAAAFRLANDYPVFGVGIRNSSNYSFQYGADQVGRVIHSQYLQTLADSGYPGFFLYLVVLGCTWGAIRRTRRVVKMGDGPDAKLAHSMLNGVEGALFIFCFGALFLSLEVFELPYVMILIGAQISALNRTQVAEAPEAVRTAPSLPAPQRA